MFTIFCVWFCSKRILVANILLFLFLNMKTNGTTDTIQTIVRCLCVWLICWLVSLVGMRYRVQMHSLAISFELYSGRDGCFVCVLLINVRCISSTKSFSTVNPSGLLMSIITVVKDIGHQPNILNNRSRWSCYSILFSVP